MADLTKENKAILLSCGQRKLFCEMETLNMFTEDTLFDLLDTDNIWGRESLVSELKNIADAWELKQLSWNLR